MFSMHAHEGRLTHDNGIRAEIQFNKYIYHMAGINVHTIFFFFYVKNKSVLPWSLEGLCTIHDTGSDDGDGLNY